MKIREEKTNLLKHFLYLFVFVSLIGYHLITYVKSWQDALNTAATLKEIHAFQLDTYIISVLVIFYLQINQNFPKLANVPASQVNSINHIPPVDGEHLKRSIQQFFEFYGSAYEPAEQLISVYVGQWEKRWPDSNENSQTDFTPEQKRFVFSAFFHIHTSTASLCLHVSSVIWILGVRRPPLGFNCKSLKVKVKSRQLSHIHLVSI